MADAVNALEAALCIALEMLNGLSSVPNWRNLGPDVYHGLAGMSTVYFISPTSTHTLTVKVMSVRVNGSIVSGTARSQFAGVAAMYLHVGNNAATLFSHARESAEQGEAQRSDADARTMKRRKTDVSSVLPAFCSFQVNLLKGQLYSYVCAA
jgi:hypothetical protein